MKHSYKHYAELQDKVRLMVYTEQPLPLTQDTIESLAYVTRNGSSVTSYKVFISGCCSGQSFLMHEFGHIVCQHLRFEETVHRQVADRMQAAMPMLEKYIIRNPEDGAGQDGLLKDLLHLFCNYAMDMEVNSRFFDANEQRFMINDLTAAEVKRLTLVSRSGFPDARRAAAILRVYRAEKRKDPAVRLARPLFPEDFGFARGLSWKRYIDLMLLSPETVMPVLCRELLARSGCFRPADGGRIRVPAGVIRRAAAGTDTKGDRSGAFTAVLESALTPGSRTSCRTKSFAVVPVGDAVRNFIARRIAMEYKETRTDYLYLSNRGKTDGVLRGKAVEHNAYVPGNVYIIVDTSSSVPVSQLSRLLDLFIGLRGMAGSDSKVIFWNTQLQKVCSLRHRIDEIPYGGGTDIAAAIAYAGSRYMKKGDKIFIISDYCDRLPRWLRKSKSCAAEPAAATASGGGMRGRRDRPTQNQDSYSSAVRWRRCSWHCSMPES